MFPFSFIAGRPAGVKNVFNLMRVPGTTSSWKDETVNRLKVNQMRILFPVSGDGKDFELHPDLHSAEYFCVYDAEEDSSPVFSKEQIIDEWKSVLSFMTLNSINAVISKNIHLMPLRVFADYRIDTFVAGADTVPGNIRLLREGKLERFGKETAVSESCASECSECKASCPSSKEAACQ